MKLTTPFLFVASPFLFSAPYAQPPNDECPDAVTIPSAPTFPYTADTVFNVQNATEGTNDPLPSCLSPSLGNSTVFPATIPPSFLPPLPVNKASIWYSWTPDISGLFDFIAVVGSDSFGNFSPTVVVFEGTSCDDALNERICSFGYATSLDIQAGATYYVFLELDIYDDIEPFAANMTLTVQPTPPPPPNDECVNAAIIPPVPTFPYSTAPVEMAQATENPTDPFLSCGGIIDGIDSGENSTFTPSTIVPSSFPSFAQSDGKTVWYSWTPAESGSYDFSTTGSLDPYGYELYTKIGIFEGDSCAAIEEMECQASGLRLRGAELVGGTTYRIKIGAFTEYGTLILTVQPTPPPPPNDECVNAAIIPSAPTFPYSTDPVEMAQATENPTDPFLSCNSFDGGIIDGGDNSTFTPSTIATIVPSVRPSFSLSDGKTVWYSWTPSESGSYDFSTTGSLDPYGVELYTTIGIFEGDSCAAIEEMKCQASGLRLRGAELVGGTTYRIKVGCFTEEGTLILTVQPTPPPPSNDACVGAIPVVSGESITGDTSNAILDNDLENTCGSFDDASGVWYKIDNTNGNVLGVIASTCDEGTTFDTKISIFKGDNCGALQCVDSVDDTLECGLSSIIGFLANEPTTYWILVHGFGSSTGTFTLTVDSAANFLTLIDSKTNGVIELLGDVVDFSFVPSSLLNIGASFSSDDDAPVESVRMTFDNPPRSFCDEAAPYSVFGDSNGNYFDGDIRIGSHLVTATAFAQSGCQGTAGTELSQSFEVVGCGIYFDIYDARDESLFSFLDWGIEVPSLPCEVNIEALAYCGFPVGAVRMELRNAATNTVVTTRTETVPPYFLFGDDNQGNIASGSIAPGAYSIQAWIDGIEHPSLNFTVADACF